jgi:hypothetical protein
MVPERAKAMFDDYMRAFARYDDDDVLQVAYDWHLKNNQACTVADLIAALYGMQRISSDEFDHPTRWTNYFEDDDGYGYATNSKTKEIECIWKPRWREERTRVINGETVVFPEKYKIQTLREHGLIKY